MSVTDGTNGTAAVIAPGMVRYTPRPHFFGEDTLRYTIDDGRGAQATALVTIIINAVNDPPVANPDELTLLENTTSYVPGTLLLSNDTDVDGDSLFLAGVAPQSAQGGTLQAVGELALFTPADFFRGSDTFTYVVTDQKGGTATGSVTLNIIGPRLDVLTGLSFNPQSGLFEQLVRVTNPVPPPVAGTMSAARVLIGNLPAGARVYNATGATNGQFYVQYDHALAPGESVDFMIEYHLLDRVNLPTPTLQAQVVRAATATEPPSPNTALSIDRVMVTQGRLLLEFTAEPGRLYALQYSSDMVNWRTAVPFLTAPANRVQWFDDGPPKTESKPEEIGLRLYRVLALPAP
jgi:hypothetical protein